MSLFTFGKAIWFPIGSVGGCSNKNDGGGTFDDLETSNNRDINFLSLINRYVEKVGILQMDGGRVFRVVCSLLKQNDFRYRGTKITWHPSPKGHRFMADVISYLLLDSLIQFTTNNFNELSNLISNKGNCVNEYA